MIELIGYVAAFFTASTMVPQIIRSIKTKHVKDISLIMILMYITNASLWVVYGLSIGAYPVVIADGLASSAGLIQLFLKIKYR
mgnify:CR=1 FL=1